MSVKRIQLPNGIGRDEWKTWKSAFEVWFTKAARIAVVMARGAYWLGERKRLMTRLGNQVFDQMQAGRGIDQAELEPLEQQLRRIDEKLHAEETLIQEIRGKA